MAAEEAEGTSVQSTLLLLLATPAKTGNRQYVTESMDMFVESQES